MCIEYKINLFYTWNFFSNTTCKDILNDTHLAIRSEVFPESGWELHAGNTPLRTPPVAIDLIAHTDSLLFIMMMICD